MKRITQMFAAVLVAGGVLVFSLGGRSGGQINTYVTVPSAQSVFFDVSFDAGSAIASIYGHGQAFMQVSIYDSDGHVVPGVGVGGRKTARMEVYRPGVFRIEVANFGL